MAEHGPVELPFYGLDKTMLRHTVLLPLVICIARIICMILTIVISIPQLLLSMIGINPPMHLRVSVKVLTDQGGNSAVTDAAVQASMDTMQKIYAQGGITVEFEGVERIAAPHLLATSNSKAGFLTSWHAEYSRMALGFCNRITVFFIDDITGGSNGFAFWGDNWCRVDAGANTDPTIMAHEVGHICALPHDSGDNTNLMFPRSGPPTNPRNTLSRTQCCWMQTSAFVTAGGRVPGRG